MRQNRSTFFLLTGLALAIALVFWSIYILLGVQEKKAENAAMKEMTDSKQVVEVSGLYGLFGEEDVAVPPGVNTDFYDKPDIQVAWINRAREIVQTNLPKGASRAEFEGLYFHRGFKGWAVTCGKVQLFNGNQPLGDQQRFVFPGVQTIYYEKDIVNFDIYWNKACQQTSDDYLPDDRKDGLRTNE